MKLVTIDPEVENILISYLTQQQLGPEIRLRTLGIGCMGAVIDFATDSPTDLDETMRFKEYTFLARKTEAEAFGGYRITKSKSGIRIRTVNRVTGGCETCYNTLRGEGCH